MFYTVLLLNLQFKWRVSIGITQSEHGQILERSQELIRLLKVWVTKFFLCQERRWGAKKQQSFERRMKQMRWYKWDKYLFLDNREKMISNPSIEVVPVESALIFFLQSSKWTDVHVLGNSKDTFSTYEKVDWRLRCLLARSPDWFNLLVHSYASLASMWETWRLWRQNYFCWMISLARIKRHLFGRQHGFFLPLFMTPMSSIFLTNIPDVSLRSLNNGILLGEWGMVLHAFNAVFLPRSVGSMRWDLLNLFQRIRKSSQGHDDRKRFSNKIILFETSSMQLVTDGAPSHSLRHSKNVYCLLRNKMHPIIIFFNIPYWARLSVEGWIYSSNPYFWYRLEIRYHMLSKEKRFNAKPWNGIQDSHDLELNLYAGNHRITSLTVFVHLFSGTVCFVGWFFEFAGKDLKVLMVVTILCLVVVLVRHNSSKIYRKGKWATLLKNQIILNSKMKKLMLAFFLIFRRQIFLM